MAIALVQSASKVHTGVNSTTLAFGSNVTAGNLIVVTHAHWQAASATITAPTDTLGHTYTGVAPEQGTGVIHLRSFYVENISGGANTVTFDVAGAAASELAVTISEWSGVATFSALDRTSAASGTNASPQSGDVTPSVDNCLLYGGMMTETNGTAITEEGGWTLLEKQTPATSVAVATQWKLQGTAALEDADWTLGVSGNWLAHVAAFKPAGTSAAKMELTPAPLQYPLTDSTGKVLSAFPVVWATWFSKLQLLANAGVASGTTAQRPTTDLYPGRPYLDTSLGANGKPIWRNGGNTAWIDATGASA